MRSIGYRRNRLANRKTALVKNPPTALGSLFLGVANRSASGRDLDARSETKFKYLGNRRVGQQPAIFKKHVPPLPFCKAKIAGTIELFKIYFKF
jgi:hypothetical protein